MLRETTKVFLACAIGAGIGSIVALEISAMFWWIGLLVGGFCGYLFYEWEEVLRAVPKAYRTVIVWRFPKYFLKTLMWEIIYVFSMFSWAFICVLVMSVFTMSDFLSIFYLMVIVIGLVMSIATIMLSSALLEDFLTREEVYNADESTRMVEDAKDFIYLFSPPTVFFWHLPRGIIFIARKTPLFVIWLIAGSISVARGSAVFFVRFSWELFLRIHSEVRLLCGIDAMVGAGIGYIAGSALIGAMAGGIIGVANYIVVTEYMLRPLGYIPVKK